MAVESIDVMVEGGKATAAPPLGPALGPLGVNIGQVISEINKKTADFKGMRVPVKISVEKAAKTFTISVGTPPSAELIKKEAGVEKGSGNPLADKVADLRIENIIKVAKMKHDALLGKDAIAKVKEILGTCDSMGIMVEGKQAREVIADINQGKFVEKIKSGKTELSVEELKKLEQERKNLEEEIKKRRAEYEAKAASIMKALEGKPRGQIKTAMAEAGVPTAIIDQFLPQEAKAEPGAAGAAKK